MTCEETSVSIWTRRAGQAAFSLIELLAVLGVTSVLLALATPAVFSSLRSSELTRAGNMIVDVASLARQTSMSRSAITAVVLSEKSDSMQEQAVAVFQLNRLLGSWEQILPWNNLPETVRAIDQDRENPKIDELAPAQFQVAGQALQQYAAFIFFPDGRMKNDSPVRTLSVRLARDNPSATREALSNYYDLDFSSDNSAFRIQRP